MARSADRTGKLVYRSLTGSAPRRTIAYICHRHYYHSPLAEEFLSGLRQWATRRKKWSNVKSADGKATREEKGQDRHA
jgi:hypothetical protein